MRVVFMGTSDFALPSLRRLHAQHEVVMVYTRPDAVAGRGRHLAPSPVKTLASELGLPLAQPATLRDAGAADTVAALAPDVIAVAAYGLLLPERVLGAARLGCLNVHASLLPRWRGAAPIERAILSGDARAGVSIMLMEESLDTGPFAAQASVEVDRKTAEGLTQELARIGADLLLEVVGTLEAGVIVWTPQEDSGVTYADKVSAADVVLRPGMTASEAERRVRASSRRAPARIVVGERVLTVLEARPSPVLLEAGHADCRDGLTLGLAEGALELVTVVPAGRSRMSAAAYARGAHLPHGCTWGPA